MNWKQIKEIIENGSYIVEGGQLDVCKASMDIEIIIKNERLDAHKKAHEQYKFDLLIQADRIKELERKLNDLDTP